MFCGNCNAPHATMTCARCHTMAYCDSTCQKKHWPEHKQICNSEKKEEQPAPRTKYAALEQCDVFQRLMKLVEKGDGSDEDNFGLLKDLMGKDMEELRENSSLDFSTLFGRLLQNPRAVAQLHHLADMSGLNNKESPFGSLKAHMLAGNLEEHDLKKMTNNLKRYIESMKPSVSAEDRAAVYNDIVDQYGVTCAAQGCELSGLRRCSRCFIVKYCGKACQRAHWPEHKPECVASTTGAATHADDDQ